MAKDDETTMKPLRGQVERRNFAVVDLESKDGETQKAGFTRPFMTGFYDGRYYWERRGRNCVADMLSLLLCNAHDGWIFYAHNGGGFDWLHFLPEIKKAGYRFEILTVGSTIQALKVFPKGNKHARGWLFLDSYKLIPLKLGKACESFASAQKKLSEQDLDAHESDASWSEYLRADCVSLWQVLTRYHELVEVALKGEVGITAASTAMKTYRRAYQREPFSRHKHLHSFFREAYYGGRVEIFRERIENAAYYDVNSSYPAAMLEPIPVGGVVEVKGQPPASVKKGRVGFARAKVLVPDSIDIPPLPVRDGETGRLIFPTGKLYGTWPTVELDFAEQMGCKVYYEYSAWIEAKPALAEFVRDMYRYRDKSRPDYDEGLSQVAKIMLNSTYGKFGMASEREKLLYLEDGEAPPDGARPANTRLDCCAWYVKEETDAAYIIPQIAAHITALARIRLLNYLLAAAARGTVAYCDTDSIITTADLSDLCSTELGAIKDEGAGERFSGEFLLPKCYRLDGDRGTTKLALKGYMSRKPETFERVKRGEQILIESFEKIGALARGNFARGPQKVVITRQLVSQDKKRVHLDDGSTRAISLDMWSE